MTWSFDADVLIYAAAPGHVLGSSVWRLLEQHAGAVCGSVLLIPEIITKPLRQGASDEIEALMAVLARLQLVDVTRRVATLAVELGATYRLKTADAIHLATAVWLGADAFVTNNRRDFPAAQVRELDIVFPG